MPIDTSLSTIPYLPNLANNMGNTNPVASNDSKDRNLLLRMLGHKHMIETVERFEWKNLPPELTTDLIERVLYYRFKGALFNYNERFYFLPFALKGEIDSYGRYIGITPVLFTGQWKASGDGKITDDISFISGKTYKVVYDLISADKEINMEDVDLDAFDQDDELSLDENAVILTDSTLEVSQDFTPMEYLIRPVIEQLVDILVLVNIDLISSAKMFYVVAKDAEQKDAIEKEFRDLDNRILNGKRVVVLTSKTDLKELMGTSVKDTARYFQSYQSIENLRKDIIGIDNGGTFMKQEHTTQMETEANSSGGSFVLNNALRMRKDFCAIANKTFGLNIDVDIKGGAKDPNIVPEGAQTKDREGDDI